MSEIKTATRSKVYCALLGFSRICCVHNVVCMFVVVRISGSGWSLIGWWSALGQGQCRLCSRHVSAFDLLQGRHNGGSGALQEGIWQMTLPVTFGDTIDNVSCNCTA